MPRGGARPNTGPKPKNPEAHAAKKAREIEAKLKALPIVPQALRDAVIHKSAVEIMREMSNAFYGLAVTYRPVMSADGKTVTAGDEGKFIEYGSEAATIAARLAPFEGPTYSSVRVTQMPVDLSLLNEEQLAQLRQLYSAATDTSGNRRGDRSPLN